MTECFVGVGANLGSPLDTFRWLHRTWADSISGAKVRFSPIYRSSPVGPGAQGDYLNAVIGFRASMPPLTLLRHLQSLENRAGRVRTERWGPRSLDLDLLLYGSERIDHPELRIPHPRLRERNFVLKPLGDLVGEDWAFSDGRTIAETLATCPPNPLHPTALDWTEEPSGSAASSQWAAP